MSRTATPARSSVGPGVVPGAADPQAPTRPVRRLRVGVVLLVALLAVVLLSAVHLTQGTSQVGVGDLWRVLTGSGEGEEVARAVLLSSRVPRLLAGVLVGVALGVAGACLQSVARNPLASPDTLAVEAGAYVAVVAAAALGLTLPVLGNGALAFVGGLGAAALVLALSAGGASGPTRLILAGSAVALALHAAAMTLLLLYAVETTGLFAWGSGTLVQSDLVAVRQMAPVVLVGVVVACLLATRLDVLLLGDDTATVMGVDVRRTRVVAVLVAVLLSAASVAVAGPIGFVGLVAPVLVRLVARRVPGLERHRALIPMSALAGILVVVGSDVLLRLVLGGQSGVDLPTGVVTTFGGAVVLVWLARRYRDHSTVNQVSRGLATGLRTHRRFLVTLAVLGVATVLCLWLGMLLGDTRLLTGDLLNWVNERSGRAITFVLDQRLPRVLAALLCGAALGVAGAAVQAVCRNPLAEPGLLGITGGAGVGAVLAVALAPTVGIWTLTGSAATGALTVFVLVYLLSWRGGGLSSDRLVLIGVGMSAGAGALITFVIVLSNPWNMTFALTWLSGSTSGRTLPQVLPVALALAVSVPLLLAGRRELDLLSIDDDTPRVLGVRLELTRLVVLGGAALLTATAVSAIGVVGFVGLVAPHAARALVGGSHLRVVPVAALLGAVLVSVADSLGRTVIAPAQLPAGLVTALLGAPYFVYLLWRTRQRRV